MSAWCAVSGLLASSTGSALLRKVLFQLEGVGLHGKVHTFEKPWYTTFESAAACWASIVIFWILKAATRKHTVTVEVQQPLLSGQLEEHAEPNPFAEEKSAPVPTVHTAEEKQYSITWKEIWALSVPGAFSVVSIIVQGMGLRYISASVSMMLSGSCVIFTAILSVLLLKCRLNYLHISGVGLTLGGILIVSTANLIWPEVSDSTHIHNQIPGLAMDFPLRAHRGHPQHGSGTAEVVLGIVLTLLSMLILAARLVSEEFALQGTNMHSLQVLGYEGMWGTLGVAFIGLPLAWVLPGGDIGDREENTVDSFYMLYENRGMNIVNWVFFFSVVGLNIFGLMVTSRLGSVFRAVLLTSRTASVWALDLLLFYMHVGGGTIGEPWINPASWFQLFGFTLLLLGTIVYAQGSSAVAQVSEQKGSDDPEADNAQNLEGLLSRASAVTRLRPYTSLYIPHGPRDIAGSSRIGDLDRRSHSLPRAVHAGAPLAGAPSISQVFRSHSYTPGAVEGRPSRARGMSPRSDESTSPQGLGSSLFVQTLTHRSSWVVDDSSRLRRGSLPFGLNALQEESGDLDSHLGGSTDQQPSSNASVFASGSLQRQPPDSIFLDPPIHDPNPRGEQNRFPTANSSQLGMPSINGASGSNTQNGGGSDKDEHSSRSEDSARSGAASRGSEVSGQAERKEEDMIQPRKPVLGQSPAAEHLMEYRRLARKSTGQMPSVTEDDQELMRATSLDEAHEQVQEARRRSLQRARSAEIAPGAPQVQEAESSAGKHVFGQSPVPAVLLSRRTTSGKSRSPQLSSFSEDEGNSEQSPIGRQKTEAAPLSSRASDSSTSSSRNSLLGQSPTPAKLMENRSLAAEKKSKQQLPAFQEAAEDSDSSSLGSSDTEAESPEDDRHRQQVHHNGADSSDSEQEDRRSRRRSLGSSLIPKRKLGSGRVVGGSSNSLQFNGEPMSL